MGWFSSAEYSRLWSWNIMKFFTHFSRGHKFILRCASLKILQWHMKGFTATNDPHISDRYIFRPIPRTSQLRVNFRRWHLGRRSRCGEENAVECRWIWWWVKIFLKQLDIDSKQQNVGSSWEPHQTNFDPSRVCDWENQWKGLDKVGHSIPGGSCRESWDGSQSPRWRRLSKGWIVGVHWKNQVTNAGNVAYHVWNPRMHHLQWNT